MYLGVIQEMGDTEAVFTDPQHIYTNALMSAALPSHPDIDREEIVLPLLTIQQFALMKIQEMQQNGQSNSSLKSVYEALITRSLFGNINASRNSA